MPFWQGNEVRVLTDEQRDALVRWKDLLEESGLERALTRDPEAKAPEIPEQFQVLVRLFDENPEVESRELEACIPGDVLTTLEALGLLKRVADKFESPYRLANHMGLWLVSEKVSPQAKCYYGNDSFELSRMLIGAEGDVLDLCSGVGPQALICARTAKHVTAVEIEPLATRLFWINAAMNGLTDKVEFLTGDLLAPVAGRKFDLISCNPPFMPVPAGVPYPVFAGGGNDGLDIVRRLMAGLPEALASDGRCEVVGAVLGDAAGPDLAAFKKMAAESSLAVIVDCRTREELQGKTLKQLVGMAMVEGKEEEVDRAFRNHFASLNATHLYCFLLHAVRAPSPMVCSSFWDGSGMGFRMETFP